MELAPIAAGRLLDRVGFRVGEAAAALDRLELLQKLLLGYPALCRIDRAGLLSCQWLWRQGDQREGQGPYDNAEVCDGDGSPLPPGVLPRQHELYRRVLP